MGARETELEQVKSTWKYAEARLKRTEMTQKEVCVAAVNQLRYAGYHLIAAISAQEEPEFLEQIRKCQGHCERASYDAIEAEVLLYLEVLKAFQETFRTIPIDVANFDYPAVKKTARKAQESIAAARHDNESRNEFYQRLDEVCVEFAERIATLEDVREELKKALQEREERLREQKAVHRRWLWGLGIASVVAVGCAYAKAVVDKVYSPPAQHADPLPPPSGAGGSATTQP